MKFTGTNASLPPAGLGCSVCNYSMWTVGFISPAKSAASVTSRSGSALLSTSWSQERRRWLAAQSRFGLKPQSLNCWVRFPCSKTPGRQKITCLPFCHLDPFPFSGCRYHCLQHHFLASGMSSQADQIGCVIVCTCAGQAPTGSRNHTTGLWSRSSISALQCFVDRQLPFITSLGSNPIGPGGLCSLIGLLTKNSRTLLVPRLEPKQHLLLC